MRVKCERNLKPNKTVAYDLIERMVLCVTMKAVQQSPFDYFAFVNIDITNVLIF